MLGIFLTVYRRKISKNLDVLDKKKLNDNRTWSTIDNTAPHVKVFSQAFKDSKSYIQANRYQSIYMEKNGVAHILL